jgi:hypothetical protein
VVITNLFPLKISENEGWKLFTSTIVCSGNGKLHFRWVRILKVRILMLLGCNAWGLFLVSQVFRFISDLLVYKRMIIFFTSRSRIFHLYGDDHCPWKAAKFKPMLGRSGSLRREESLSCHTCCDMEPRFFFPVSSEGPPHLIAYNDSQGDAEDLFLPGSSRTHVQKKYCWYITECLKLEWDLSKSPRTEKKIFKLGRFCVVRVTRIQRQNVYAIHTFMRWFE